jgi:hypothetical protein
MASVVANLPAGTAKPTGMIQFGNRHMICYEDLRPIVLMANGNDGSIKAYQAGIKPPVTYPSVEESATSASNITYSSDGGNNVYVAYAFYSSKRVCYSRLSPVATYTIGVAPKKLTISGFEHPRDDAMANDIDAIVVAVQMGQNQGLMCVLPTMQVDCSTFAFDTASLTFDMNDEQLELGFDFSAADAYYDVPPACQYIARYGERLWLGGQRRSIEFANSGIALTKGVSWRGETVARLKLSGDGQFNDSHLYHQVYINSNYVGDIWDVQDGQWAYLDRDAAADIGQTTQFYLAGYANRIWPTSYHNDTAGNVPIAFPECVNLLHRQVLLPGIDRGEVVKGLVGSANDFMVIIMNETVQTMTEGLEVGVPFPTIRNDYGRVGAIAPRSVCVDLDGAVAWISEEGLVRANTGGGIDSLSHQLGIDQMWKGGRWIKRETLKDIVMTYSRQYEGYVFAGFQIYNTTTDAYETGWWGLLTLKPQLGLWLFDGQVVTSNLIEYQDENGQGVILAGDDYLGRVKRMLDPDTLQDVAKAAATVADFTWEWREGWRSIPSGGQYSLDTVELVGVIVPKGALTTSAAADSPLTLSWWSKDQPLRHEDDLAATDIVTATVDYPNLLRRLPGPMRQARYHSLGISGSSTTGATGTRPVEVVRWITRVRGE